MNKKILPAFQLPRLVVGKYRTYILVYAEDKSGRVERYRPTFNLNRIADLEQRKERGLQLVEKIKAWLSAGYYFVDFEERTLAVVLERQEKYNTNILEAFEFVEKLKTNGDRESSNASYRSHIKIFREYLKANKLTQFAVTQFSKSHAYQYLDYHRDVRKISNVSLNNVLTYQVTMWNDLARRGYLKMEDNPFAGIARFKKEKKIRRNFSKEEAKVVLKAIWDKSKILFYSLILEYACLIRPAEMRRMRFHNIYVEEGIIVVEADQAKNYRERIVTIPDDFLVFFQEPFWSKYPKDYLIFGEKGNPHPSKAIGKNTLSAKHKRILDALHKKGQLKKRAGLQYYSWKDTGITDVIDRIGLMEACDHAGHSDPRITLRYRHRQIINKKMKVFKNDLIEPLTELGQAPQ